MRSFWNRLPIGTRSVLLGAHCFLIHPFFVALGWWYLYGFPWDPRLWVAFFVHDLGYFGKHDIDGEEGQSHPVTGAHIMNILFDRGSHFHDLGPDPRWFYFCLYHSRYFCRLNGVQPSRLCAADEMACALTPWWLFLPMTRISGELSGYIALSEKRAAGGEPVFYPARTSSIPEKHWYFTIQEFSRRWACEFRYGGDDTWTPEKA